MKMSELYLKAREACQNSGYGNNAEEIQSVSIQCYLDRHGFSFHISCAREIAPGNTKAIYAKGDSAESVLKKFADEVKFVRDRDNIELE